MLASFLQQVYTYANWDMVKEQERLDSIETAEEGMFFDVGSNKVIKAFYYIQILCYNIGGTLIAFWYVWIMANQARSNSLAGPSFYGRVFSLWREIGGGQGRLQLRQRRLQLRLHVHCLESRRRIYLPINH
jgi:hypothetical protein